MRWSDRTTITTQTVTDFERRQFDALKTEIYAEARAPTRCPPASSQPKSAPFSGLHIPADVRPMAATLLKMLDTGNRLGRV